RSLRHEPGTDDESSPSERPKVHRLFWRGSETERSLSEHSMNERPRAHHLFRRGGETERSLIELLQPVSSTTHADQDKQADKDRHPDEYSHGQRTSAWHRLRRMYPASVRLRWARGDDDTASDSAVQHTPRHRDLERVYRDGVQLAQTLGTSALNRAEIRRILRQAQGDADAARRRVQLLLSARDGIVSDIDAGVRLRGAENAGSTCYIDSVFAALFAAHTACDGLLYMRDLGSDDANALQALCRLLANYLRAGELIGVELMTLLRAQLVRCGWPGAKGQQDAGELYMFLAETLHMPYLPLEVYMEHGADADADDSRMVTQRVIELALPDNAAPEDPESSVPDNLAPEDSESLLPNNSVTGDPESPHPDDSAPEDPALAPPDSNAPVPLHALLARHFFDNRVEHVERELRGNDEPVKVRTGAWAMLAMHPFYTPQSEIGSDAADAEFLGAEPLVVPLLLKRYRGDSTGVRRIACRVDVPVELDVTDIISTSRRAKSDNDKEGDQKGRNRDRGDSVWRARESSSHGLAEPPPYTPSMRYRLVLRAAVCHKGGSASSGHYVTYATRDARHRPGNQAAAVPHLSAVETQSLDDVALQRLGDVALHDSSDVARHSPGDVAAEQPETEFLRFDDMDTVHGRVQRFAGEGGVSSCLREIAADGYMLFYTLQPGEPSTADCPRLCVQSPAGSQQA
ncbi:hypothetical protein IWW50_003565, partial [Coemansia erecta]